MKGYNLLGQTFGRLKVLSKTSSRNGVKWLCKCNCGKFVLVGTGDLTHGKTKSCGCLKRESSRQRRSKYFIDDKVLQNRLYRIWFHIKNRCYNPKNKSYTYYGGRGIEVCEEWRNDFMRFFDWSLKNGYAEKLTIDRIDFNGNYCPENCRWITIQEQQRNKRNNKFLTIKDEAKTLREWCDIFSIDVKMVKWRLQIGWDIYKALTTPKRDIRKITINNESKTISEWCVVYHISKSAVKRRLCLGWDEVKAVTTPTRAHKEYKRKVINV